MPPDLPSAISDSTTIGRLAPSPTGAQHIGNARTYLIAWLSARAQQGRVVLRVEDIDSPRIKPGAADQAYADLRWLGLDWDVGPIIQTQRLSHYEQALEQLKRLELVYPCTCTRTDVERAASAPHQEHEAPVYPGTCSGRTSADAGTLGDHPFAWRMRVDEASVRRCFVVPATGGAYQDLVSFDDGFLGHVGVDLRAAGGDFVVWKSGGTPAYQLAVIVDDAAQGVTEVIRGDDLVSSTPRQLLLYRALGLTPPRFVHVPLVVGPDGRRLAKRHGDTRLETLRKAGVAPQALLGLLAWSCGWSTDLEPFAARKLVERFTLRTIPKQPFVLTADILRRIGYG